jgi:chorismate mutase
VSESTIGSIAASTVNADEAAPSAAETEAEATADAAAAAGKTATAAVPETPAPPAVSAEQSIAANRRLVDDLDARIIALVQERMTVSGEIQAARIGSGGRRVHLAREMEVMRTYGDALGRPGTAVALTLLELCRGRV